MASDRSFTKLGADVAELDRAANERLADAELLFAAGRYNTAVIMAFYALEICLKVLICRRLDLEKLPSAFEIHDIEGLLVLSGLFRKLKGIKRPRGVRESWDKLVEDSKIIIDLRYGTDPRWDRAWASGILGLLRDTPNGVLPWLSKQA